MSRSHSSITSTAFSGMSPGTPPLSFSTPPVARVAAPENPLDAFPTHLKRYVLAALGKRVISVSRKRPIDYTLAGLQRHSSIRRWVGGLLSDLLGRGGTQQIAELAGLDPKTIRQGRIDLKRQLEDYPDNGRVRRPGGGRPPLKKKIPPSSKSPAFRAVPRLWRPETPEPLPYPILSGMSRPRKAAPRLAARRFASSRGVLGEPPATGAGGPEVSGGNGGRKCRLDFLFVGGL